MSTVSAPHGGLLQRAINALLFPQTMVLHWAALCLSMAMLVQLGGGVCALLELGAARVRGNPCTFVALLALLVAHIRAAARDRAPIAPIAPYRARLAVLVTGCDSGFGFGVSRLLACRGFQVFAGCLTDEGVARLDTWTRRKRTTAGGEQLFPGEPPAFAAHSEPKMAEGNDASQGTEARAEAETAEGVHLTAFRLDVTRQGDLEACVARVSAATGGRLFALVNNAGVNLGCMAEWTSMSLCRKVFDVNFFGVVALSKLCMPMLRKQQHLLAAEAELAGSRRAGCHDAAPAARIINVSSVLGVAPLPALSSYVASKHAVEAFTRVLRAECLACGGVRVVGLNPGFFRTELLAAGITQVEAAWENMASSGGAAGNVEVQAAWGGAAYYRHFLGAAQLMAGVGGQPTDVVETLAQAVCATRPRPRYWVGLDAKLFFRAMAIAPDWIVDTVMALALHVPPMAL